MEPKENIYKSPKAALVEEKGEEKIGGWLRFFQIINILGVVIFVVIFALAIPIMLIIGGSPGDWIDMGAVLVESLPAVIFSILILKRLGLRSEGTPNVITKYIALGALSSVVVAAGLYFAYNGGHISEKPSSVLGSFVYYLIWTSYFKRSKRVHSFYGANSGNET